MFKKTLLAASAVALFMGAGAASAATVSYNYINAALGPNSGAFPTTDWFATFDLPKFDSTLGTLTSVQLNVGAAWDGSIHATNNTGGPVTATVTLRGEVGVGPGTNTEASATAGTATWWMYAEGSQVRSGSIPAGGTLDLQTTGVLNAAASASITGAASVVTNPTSPSPAFDTTALGSLFTSLQAAGGGLFHMSAYGANRHTLSIGNFSAVGTGTSTPSVSVTYTYNTPTVPEPTSLALLAMGAAGFAASRRRKAA